MTRLQWFMAVWLLGSIVLGSTGLSEAVVLKKAGFDNGDLAGWETFETPNGTMGGTGFPKILPFKTMGPGRLSPSLQFKVGQVRYQAEKDPQQGGGLVTDIATKGGPLNLSAHLAITYVSPKDKRNLAGGLFEWLVDDQVLASHDVGPIENGGVIRHQFQAHHHIAEGTHTIRLRITRPFTSLVGQPSPLQFVDNLLIQISPNP